MSQSSKYSMDNLQSFPTVRPTGPRTSKVSTMADTAPMGPDRKGVHEGADDAPVELTPNPKMMLPITVTDVHLPKVMSSRGTTQAQKNAK